MKKKRKKWPIVVAVTAVLAVVIVMLLPKNSAPVMAAINTEPLAKTTLRNTISATGMVESDESTNVYAKLTGATVETVNVEVGDRVSAGDVLCQFDTEDIEDQIARLRTQISEANAQNAQSIKLSQKQYEQQVDNFENDRNSSLNQAQDAVTNAQIALKNAQYEVDHFGEASSDTDFQSDEQLYAVAKDEYIDAKKDYDDAYEALEEAKRNQIPKEQQEQLLGLYNAAKQKLQLKESDYDDAKDRYFNIDHRYQMLLDNLSQAQTAYDRALQSFDILWKSTLDNIDNAKDNVDTNVIRSSQASNQLSLSQTEKQLEDATVTAPVSGTITAVYAKEGAVGSGILFIIEDTDRLKIRTTVKEYDLPSIKVGQKVEIKSDGTGDAVMNGVIEKIAPTAVKSEAASNSVEFEVEINVEPPHEGLLIGMKTRASIILEQADNVFGVPYDAVLTDADGSSYILVSEPGEKENTARKVPVQVGLESDFYVEISGSELSEGMQVITSPLGITEGMALPAAQPPAET